MANWSEQQTLTAKFMSGSILVSINNIYSLVYPWSFAAFQTCGLFFWNWQRYFFFKPRISGCFFNKHGSLVKDVNDIKGLTDLRWDDQQTLKKFVGGEDENEDEEMEDDNVEGVVVEYAKSGRAKVC